MNMVPYAEKMLIITGPTGVGKTDFSLTLAGLLDGEICNADVGQFYTPLTIGTAKPAWRESAIKHHLFDIIDRPEHLNMVSFREKISACMRAMAPRLPLLVGGSGFYIQGLLFSLCDTTQVPARQYAQETEQLWHTLVAIDPARAAHISMSDRYRITRALDIWYGTGILPSQCAPTFQPLARDTLLVILTRPLQDLHERINTRTQAMIQAGWLDEVRSLDEQWQQFLLDKKLIGYDDAIAHVRGQTTLVQLIERIQQKTRQYAKRQLTFMRMLERRCRALDGVAIYWAHADDVHLTERIKEWYES